MARPRTGLTPARAVAYLVAPGRPLGVIGASALSAPELWDGKSPGRAFDTVYPVDLAAGPAVDVGFRLAFTAPREPPALRVKRLLAQQGYLQPPGD